jgi:hypothetical protein
MKYAACLALAALIATGCHQEPGDVNVSRGTNTTVTVDKTTVPQPVPATGGTTRIEVTQPGAPPAPAPDVNVQVTSSPSTTVITPPSGGVSSPSPSGGQSPGSSGVSSPSPDLGSVDPAMTTTPDADGPIVVEGSNETRSYTAQDQPVEVDGKGHNITVTGSVTDLTVSGENNNVTVDKVSHVTLSGTGNTVKYGGTPPDVQITGTGNKAEKK